MSSCDEVTSIDIFTTTTAVQRVLLHAGFSAYSSVNAETAITLYTCVTTRAVICDDLSPQLLISRTSN